MKQRKKSLFEDLAESQGTKTWQEVKTERTKTDPEYVQEIEAAAKGKIEGILPMALAAAIPLWIAQFQKQSWETVQARLSETVKDLPSLLGARGDVLLYGSKKEGEAADLFNRLAEAIALMSFLPGGISTFGNKWESTHPEA